MSNRSNIKWQMYNLREVNESFSFQWETSCIWKEHFVEILDEKLVQLWMLLMTMNEPDIVDIIHLSSPSACFMDNPQGGLQDGSEGAVGAGGGRVGAVLHVRGQHAGWGEGEL